MDDLSVDSPVDPPAETGAPEGAARAAVSPAQRGSIGRWFWEWTKSIFVAFLLFLFVRTFIVEAFQIPTASMENTLLVGDFLLVNKMAYGAEIPGTNITLPGFDRPERGDVIVFEPPPTAGQPPRTNYVKRIVGVPGDTLAMVDGELILNGEKLDEGYVKRGDRVGDVRSAQFQWQLDYQVRPALHRRPTRDNWDSLVVPPESFFVMGDNRANSEDSRYWGFVPSASIKGRPLIIYYSYDRRKVQPLRWLTEIRWNRLLHAIR